MPAPPEIRKKLAEHAEAALDRLIDAVWDEATKSALAEASNRMQQLQHFFASGGILPPGPGPEPVNPFSPSPAASGPARARILYDHPSSLAAMSPQKRGALNRERKGVVKNAIKDVIYSTKTGVTRAFIRDMAKLLHGLTIKEGSMKQGLRLLREAKEIENRDGQWFPTKNGGQSDD